MIFDNHIYYEYIQARQVSVPSFCKEVPEEKNTALKFNQIK